MRAIYNGVTIADSDDTIVVEANHYFPPDSIRREHLSLDRRDPRPDRARRARPELRLWTAFGLLAFFWLIGAAAGAIWWARGIEARGLTLEALAAQPS